MPTNKTIDCQCGHSITAHLTVCDDCSCYKFESKSTPTPNPQEKMYIGSIGGVPIISDPKATEPHFRDPLTSDPQESSPGFEEVLRIFIANLSVTRRPREGDPIFSDVLAAHQKEIQAAKREGIQQARNVLHDHGWYDACATLDQMIKKQLEEETTA